MQFLPQEEGGSQTKSVHWKSMSTGKLHYYSKQERVRERVKVREKEKVRENKRALSSFPFVNQHLRCLALEV